MTDAPSPWTADHTPCAMCGRQMPPERDPRVRVYCSPACYGREVAAHPIVRIHRSKEVDR